MILNGDQTGIKIVPSSTLDAQGSRRVEAVGVNDKCLITAVFCGVALSPEISYKQSR